MAAERAKTMESRMSRNTDDLRIHQIDPLPTPAELIAKVSCDDVVSQTVNDARRSLNGILHGRSDRLAVIIGPCSIHDPVAALDYARRLAQQRERFSDTLEIVMRVYFEKPRTTVGWKGLINDPYLDGSFCIDEGLLIARKLLRDINALGLPAGTEFLDMISPQYVADLVAWGAIGARTTESQVHRELASGLSCPVGFKNGTNGNVKIAVDAAQAASHGHHFLSVTKNGQTAIVTTTGNNDCHVILRGGRETNYDAQSIADAARLLEESGLSPRLMVDASHANSGKKAENQPRVIDAIASQVEAGDRRILGVMVESHLLGGRQDVVTGHPLVYGQSITDACIGWEDSVAVLERLDQAVRQRRALPADEVAA